MPDRPRRASSLRWFLAKVGAGIAALCLIVVAGGIYWLESRARAQREAVAAIKQARGSVFYAWDDPQTSDVSVVVARSGLPDWLLSWTWSGGGESDVAGPPAPAWLVSMLGVDCFGDVTSVTLPRRAPARLLEQIAHLKQLRTLRLDGSNLGEQGMAAFKSLDNLENLTLVRCRFAGRGFAHMAGLKKLQVLNLEATNVDDNALASLQALLAVEELNLAGTPITDAGMRSLRGLTMLRDLNLSRTAISDAGLEPLSNLTRLVQLSLNRTPLGGAGLVYLKGLTRLEELGLESTSVGDAALAHLAGAVNLKILQLKGTPVGDTGVAQLKGLTNLQELTLDRTAVTDAALAHVTDLPHLVILSVQHTRVTEAAVTALKTRRAQLQVQQLAATGTGVVPPETAITDLEIVH